MNGYLIDTDIAIDLLKGRQRGIDAVASLLPVPTMLSAVTIGELVHGVEYGPHPGPGRTRLESYLQQYPILPFDGDVARIFGRIRAELYRSDQRLDNPDLMIAATALFHELTLVTGNLRHFQRIPGLTLASI